MGSVSTSPILLRVRRKDSKYFFFRLLNSEYNNPEYLVLEVLRFLPDQFIHRLRSYSQAISRAFSFPYSF
jgi:hypothetical protein